MLIIYFVDYFLTNAHYSDTLSSSHYQCYTHKAKRALNTKNTYIYIFIFVINIIPKLLNNLKIEPKLTMI